MKARRRCTDTGPFSSGRSACLVQSTLGVHSTPNRSIERLIAFDGKCAAAAARQAVEPRHHGRIAWAGFLHQLGERLAVGLGAAAWRFSYNYRPGERAWGRRPRGVWAISVAPSPQRPPKSSILAGAASFGHGTEMRLGSGAKAAAVWRSTGGNHGQRRLRFSAVLLYGIIRHGDCPRGREPAHLMQCST
jgi:hypothetical protein